jgi:pimeloyl-ACP methyl ester carboxylesterase
MPVAALSGLQTIDDIKMYYAVYGAGSPVLLIHGGGGNADQWGAIVTDLSETHQVIVADSRGHGRTGFTDKPLGYDLMASDYIALLDYLKIKQVALIGWSDGGVIGLSIAIHHPERLSRLFAHAGSATLAGALPIDWSMPTMSGIYERNSLAYTAISPTPEKLDAFVNALNTLWSTEPNWSDDVLAEITVPTTIAIGDHDEMVSFAHNQHLAGVIPGARFVELKDTSHFSIFQDPEGYLDALHEFLDGY